MLCSLIKDGPITDATVWGRREFSNRLPSWHRLCGALRSFQFPSRKTVMLSKRGGEMVMANSA